MEENKNIAVYLKPLMLGILSGAIAITLLFLLSAFIIANVNVSVPSISIIVSICGGLGAFISGFVASKTLKRKGLLMGLLCGITLGLILIVCTILFSGNLVSGESITKFLIIMVSSILGGAIGVNTKNKK